MIWVLDITISYEYEWQTTDDSFESMIIWSKPEWEWILIREYRIDFSERE